MQQDACGAKFLRYDLPLSRPGSRLIVAVHSFHGEIALSENKDEIHEPVEESSEEREASEASNEANEADELEQLRKERDELRERLLRTAADFENYRKRARKDVEEALRTGREAVVRELLPIVDNLSRADEAASSAESVEAVAEGVKMILRSFDDVSERIGLERVKTVGERFDPAVHEAVQQVETDEAEPGTIIAEALAGYKMGPRLLRAAMVVVAKKHAG